MIIKWLWYSNAKDCVLLMIFKCERYLFDYDIQMWINIKCELFANDYVIQMKMISKCECSANDYDIQMRIIIIWLWFLNANDF